MCLIYPIPYCSERRHHINQRSAFNGAFCISADRIFHHLTSMRLFVCVDLVIRTRETNTHECMYYMCISEIKSDLFHDCFSDFLFFIRCVCCMCCIYTELIFTLIDNAVAVSRARARVHSRKRQCRNFVSK